MFENGIPKPIQGLLKEMIKSAAPQLVEQIDGLAQIVQKFAAQLDAIEVQQAQNMMMLRAIMKHHKIPMLILTEQTNVGLPTGNGGSIGETGSSETG